MQDQCPHGHWQRRQTRASVLEPVVHGDGTQAAEAIQANRFAVHFHAGYALFKEFPAEIVHLRFKGEVVDQQRSQRGDECILRSAPHSVSSSVDAVRLRINKWE